MRRTFFPEEKYVKVSGRTIMTDSCRVLCTSASGVEFIYTGTWLKVTFYGDSSSNAKDGMVYWRDIPRVQVLVDDRIMLDTTIKNSRESYVVYGEDPSTEVQTHTVKIVKLSEPRMSQVGIGEIEIDSTELPKPVEKKEKFVEFIGDSITCGYGVDTDDELCPFSTGTENATKAYAYLAAKMLDVDYSLVSYSGHGLVSGWTPNPDVPQKEELIQPYYEITSYSYNNFEAIMPQNYKWNFDRKPDVIVINLGTNDYSYTQMDEGKISEYERCYVNFLKQIREINPDSHIICSLGVMGDELYPAVERVVNRYSDEEQDVNISAFHFSVQNPEKNGYAADYHPSTITQKIAAHEMAEELKKWL